MSDAEPNNTQDHAEPSDNQPINIKVCPRLLHTPGIDPGRRVLSRASAADDVPFALPGDHAEQ